jgi:hypothetical protein
MLARPSALPRRIERIMTTPQYGYVPSPFSRGKTWVMAHKGLTALMACGVVVLGAAGGKLATRNSGPPTFLATGSSQVVLIQWTGSGYLQGTLTYDSTSGTPPNATISGQRVSFTGQVNGSSVTLNFSAFFVTSTIYGTLNGGTLTLNFPQDNGTIQPSTFVSSDLGTFNTDVAALQRRINHANTVAQIAQEQQQQQAQNAQEEQSVQNDVSTLQQDASLASGSNLSSDLANFASDVQSSHSDLKTAQQDARQSKGYCNASLMVNGDTQSLDGDLQSIQGDIQSTQADMATARSDIQMVQEGVAALSSKGLTVPADASAVISTAKANLRQAISQANGYIDRANANDAQGYQIAQGLATASCSGPGNPTAPVPHIH